MKYLKYIIILAALIIQWSCTKELPLPDLNADQRLVINGYLSAEQPVEIHISESCGLNDTNCIDNFISDAEVFMNDGSENISLEHQGQGIYSNASYMIKPNSNYTIVAKQKERTATAHSKIPDSFTANYLGSDEIESEWGIVRAFDFEIIDDPAVENYYILEGYIEILDRTRDEGFSSEVNGYEEPVSSHYTNDPNAENKELAAGIDYEEWALRRVFLPDANFNGESYQTRFVIRDSEILYTGAADSSRAHVSVRSVSKEFYEYEKSLTKLRLSRGDLFQEPELVYSNIENGLGIFAGYVEHKFIDDLPPTKFKMPQNINVDNDNCISTCTVKFHTDGGSNLDYNWTFGDGGSSKDANPEHTYTEPGQFDVNLFIPLGNGDSAGWNFQVTIR